MRVAPVQQQPAPVAPRREEDVAALPSAELAAALQKVEADRDEPAMDDTLRLYLYAIGLARDVATPEALEREGVGRRANRAWQPTTLNEGHALGGPLYVLPGASIESVERYDAVPMVFTRQAVGTVLVSVFQWREPVAGRKDDLVRSLDELQMVFRDAGMTEESVTVVRGDHVLVGRAALPTDSLRALLYAAVPDSSGN